MVAQRKLWAYGPLLLSFDVTARGDKPRSNAETEIWRDRIYLEVHAPEGYETTNGGHASGDLAEVYRCMDPNYQPDIDSDFGSDDNSLVCDFSDSESD